MWRIVFILLIFLAGQLATGLISVSLAGGTPNAVDPVTIGRVSGAVNLAILFILPAAKLTARRLPPNRQPLFTISTVVALFATIALMLAVNAAILLLEFDDNGTTEVFQGMMHDPLCLLSLAVVGPLAEEAVFRAGLIPSMTRAGLNRWAAAGLAALVFALVHGNAAQGTSAFVMGALFGAFYVISGDIRLSALAHVTVNSMGLISYALDDQPDSPLGTSGLLLLTLVSAVVVAVGITLWAKLTIRKA